jgi:hypothetical protein
VRWVDLDVFGPVFEIDLVDGAPLLAYIIHRGDNKDPGPDQFLVFDEWGYEVWQLEGEHPSDPAQPHYVLPIVSEGAAPGNLPPIADANGPYTVDEGATAVLDGSGSFDPESRPLTYEWDLDGDGLFGEIGVAAERGDEVGSAPTFSAVGLDGPALVTVRLTVTDDLGLTDTANASMSLVNLPPEVTVSLDTQTVQYSDGIVDVIITSTDVADDDPLTAIAAGLPGGTSLTPGGCATNGQVTCSWTVSGIADAVAGTYDITVTVTDPDGGSTAVVTTVVVELEDAVVFFADTNEIAVPVAGEGGDSGPFALTVIIQEWFPDLAIDTAYPGDISLADISMALIPMGPGNPETGTCNPPGVIGTGYDAELTVTCDFTGVPVNTYAVSASIGGDYYTGSSEDVLVVYDPSLGFTTGGGWFYWPGTDDKTNFGYTMKYNKKGTNVKGSLLVIRYLDDGSIYRIKSNSLVGLAIGHDSSVPMGWASFAGKATYLAPGWPDPVGNHEFRVYVEDRDEPGTGIDRFWLQVLDKNDNLIPAMSMGVTAVANAVELNGGNIVVPHAPAKGKGRAQAE